MNALPRWRRWAVKLAQHAARVLPGAGSDRTSAACSDSWADAMQREIDYIEDDRAALRWALGCVLASYKTRLAADSRCISVREVLRHAAACGALMLVIGFALLGHAASQTEPPRPVPDEATCGTPETVPEARALPNGAAGDSRRDGPAGRISDPAPETSCAARDAPARVVPKYQTR
jgi:hypothetical protein